MLTEKVNSMQENVIQKEHPTLHKFDVESMSGAIPDTMNAKRKKAVLGFNPRQQLSATHVFSCFSTTWGVGRRIRKKKK